MRCRRLPRPWPVLVALSLLATGCSKSKSTSPITDGACAQKAQDALTQLESVLYAELNSDPTRPSDIDFQAPYQLFQEVLACDATNANANFGIAITGLLALTADPEVNAAFDEWKAYLETRTPFEATTTRARPLGVPVTLAAGREALRLPFLIVPISTLAFANPSRIAVDPQLDRVQAILENRALPRLNQALAGLSVAASNPGYRFVVTPRMQGDEGATPVEIDRADLLALRAAVSLLASACHVAVSYRISLAAYDSTSLAQAFEQGGNWLALRPQGASHMGAAGMTLVGAVDDVDQAIVSLLSENDPQDDDVIKVGPDFTRAELESLRVHLPEVKSALQNGLTVTEDWDGDPFTPDVPLTIRSGRLFTNPVPNWKALFPSYAASAVRRSFDSQWVFESGFVRAEVDVPADGNYFGSYSLYVQPGGPPSESFYGDAFLQAAVTQVVQDRYAAAQLVPGWNGSFSGYGSTSGFLNAGVDSTWINYNGGYGVATREVFVPMITWTADSFDQWSWPDPTLNGLLPDMSSSDHLKNTFGMTADQWSKELILDWTGGGSLATAGRRTTLPRLASRRLP